MWFCAVAAMAGVGTRAELDERGRAPIEVAPEVAAGPVVLYGGTVMTAAGRGVPG